MPFTRLSDAREYHIPGNEPQLIGYGFHDQTGDRLGKVTDLIADTDAMKVRFLIVSLDRGLLSKTDVIVPVRDVSIDDAGDRVICTDCSEERLRSYPKYEGGALPDLQKRFAATFVPHTGTVERPTAGPTHREGILERAKDRIEEATERRRLRHEEHATHAEPVAGEQRMELIEEELQVGKREVQTGEAVLRKTVHEEKVCEPVELRQERVSIERHPVNREATGAEIGKTEQEIRVPIMGEEVVSRKVPFIREEIVIHKESDVEHREVCERLRKEDVDTSGLQEVSKTEAPRDMRRTGTTEVGKTEPATGEGIVEEQGRFTDRPTL